MNEFFTYLKDITLSPGYLKGFRIFLVTAVIPGPKISCSRQLNNVNAAVTLIASGVRSIDRSLFLIIVK